MGFSEAVVAYDIKVDIYNQLNVFFLYKYQRSRSLIDLDATDSVFLSSFLKLLG